MNKILDAIQSKINPAQGDVVDLILEDHKSLKEAIAIMKDGERTLDERRMAFDSFAVDLVSHAKPEEESLYVSMKKSEETREMALEGDVEHGLADQMLEEIKRTTDAELWSARVKVLAELVDHHIKEEENDLLPEYRANSTPEERIKVGSRFLLLKTEMLGQGGVDSPKESELASESTITQRH